METRNNSSLTSQWKPDLIQLSPPLRRRSWIRQRKSKQTVARITGVGSRIAGLQNKAKRISEVCVQHGLRSVGGLQVASGWLTSVLLALFWVVSTDSTGFFLLLAIASRWVTSILLFCCSHCVVCTYPLTLCILSVAALRSSFCFRLVLLVLLVMPVGGLGVASGGFAQFLLLFFFLFFPVLDRSVGQRLPCSEPHLRFFMLFCGVYCDLEESSTLLRLTWYLAGKYALIGIF